MLFKVYFKDIFMLNGKIFYLTLIILFDLKPYDLDHSNSM